jgi:hypothetical protein
MATITDYHTLMLGQIKENIDMAVKESEWEDDVCQSSITLSVPHKFKTLTLTDDEMAAHATKCFQSSLNDESKVVVIKSYFGGRKPYSIHSRYSYTLTLDSIVDEDDLASMGDDDHYIQFEFTITRKLLGFVRK